MKNFILAFTLLITITTNAQKQDLQKKSKDELIKVIGEKETQIKKLEEEIKSSKKAAKENGEKVTSESKNETKKLKDIIEANNTIFLMDLFQNKYVDNKKYFTETDLSLEDNKVKFINSNALIKSIEQNASGETLKICKKALEFNENYLELFEIRKLLNEKYDAKKTEEGLAAIKKLPELDNNSKLSITKTKIKDLLSLFEERSCELKKSLDTYKKNPDQNATFKQNYTKLEKSELYKDFPYLISVLKEIKNNVNNYTEEDLDKCTEKQSQKN